MANNNFNCFAKAEEKSISKSSKNLRTQKYLLRCLHELSTPAGGNKCYAQTPSNDPMMMMDDANLLEDRSYVNFDWSTMSFM